MSRQAEIIEILQDEGFQSVVELARRLGVNPSTIRREFEKLEQLELIQRTHGGAYPVKQTDTPSLIKESLHHREKEAIGRAMADKVLDGQTILLDSGSTTLEVAKHLDNSRLTVVTNDLRIGLEIANRQCAHLVLIGGELLPNVYTLWGPSSVQQIEQLRVDVAIFGADTVDEQGIFNTSSYELELKRTMRSIAKEAFFVADSSKFGREALFKVFGLDQFTAGITDDLLDPIRASHFPVPIISVSPQRLAKK
ncbi:DeoR/GlpR family DNA-binding transcription regulator [Arthrobacter sp. MDB2-24]|jgi:DeoR/GlpR family transcriptional regulator of sugar metabolism|uniref:DeoR/GlpR family DNA-binding transcription regulator n=1 Tax=Arthrobacter burdickii TaxID=3035920 RepID=A0ABT8K461_9MICC|nr:DeoR/GlpR family DNA-binding transcription regulator [Arthrobacter burdickii]MDN4612225.1 DeoR/GlpR family DNA-binding transcription regulator [Arthrobacter burdickii]